MGANSRPSRDDRFQQTLRLRVAEIRANAIADDYYWELPEQQRQSLAQAAEIPEWLWITGETGLQSFRWRLHRVDDARRGRCGFVFRDDSDQIAPAMGSLQRFLAEEAAGALGRHGGAMSHERSASAASRNVWLLMAAW